MNNSNRSLAGSLLATLLLATGCIAADPGGTSDAGRDAFDVTVVVDPRVELVAITQHLSGYTDSPRYEGRISDLDHPYINGIKQHFAGYKDHDSLRQLKQLGIGGGAPMAIAVQMSNPDDATIEGPISGLNTKKETEAARAYVENLRAFAKAANFMAFYEANRASYAALIDDFKREIDTRSIAMQTAGYCGTKPEGFTIVLAPLLARTSFGPSATAPDGTKIAYAIVPAERVVDGRLMFGTRSRLGWGLCHEFGHSFINPLVDQHWEELAKHSALMGMTRYAPRTNYGRGWKICVYEHIVRAMTARIVLQTNGSEAYANQLARDKDTGLIFVEDLCRSLETYEQNRDKYPDLDSYFPELVRVFAGLHQAAPAMQATPEAGGAKKSPGDKNS